MDAIKGSTVASYEVFYQFIGAIKNVSGGNTSNTELVNFVPQQTVSANRASSSHTIPADPGSNCFNCQYNSCVW